MTSPLDTCLTGIDSALTTLLAARRRHRADARVVFAADVRQLVQAYCEAEVKDTRAALARVDRDRERAHADLSETARTAAHRLRMIDALRDELTETRASLEGQLAMARDHLCEPLPQRQKTAPEPNDATSAPAATAPDGSVKPAAARKAARPQSGEGGAARTRTGRSRATDSRTIGVVTNDRRPTTEG